MLFLRIEEQVVEHSALDEERYREYRCGKNQRANSFLLEGLIIHYLATQHEGIKHGLVLKRVYVVGDEALQKFGAVAPKNTKEASTC